MVSMMFLSIDGGFKNLGYAVWKDNKLYQSGVWIFRDREEAEPFSVFRDKGILYRYNILPMTEVDLVVSETMPMQNLSIQRALTLSALVAIRIAAYNCNVQWNELSAVTVKKYITGSGRATKAQMRRKIIELYPQILKCRKLGDVMFDEADAIALGHTWIGLNGKSKEGKGRQT